jgi:hypothetical protein
MRNADDLAATHLQVLFDACRFPRPHGSISMLCYAVMDVDAHGQANW